MRGRLLVVELWGLGDLVIATPFLQVASQHYEVTLLAKPYALDLRSRFWPQVQVAPFVAPWTSFRRKYRVFSWPWREIFRLRRLAAQRFNWGLSARWDPRNHVLLDVLRVKRRLGFARLHSQSFLSDPLPRPEASAHRYEYWRALGRALQLEVPARQQLESHPQAAGQEVLIHTGAGQPVRVWPLERYAWMVQGLRQLGYRVQVACNPDQKGWWLDSGEASVATPRTVSELLSHIDRAGAVVGNDSGPSHLAALCGVPTFTFFGPQLPEWFAPLHPRGEWLEGKPCPFKPCSDYCRFAVPFCMVNQGQEEAWQHVSAFLKRVLPR